ncbi:helix-hairpin-helix domain-containing protein [Desulfuromonas acetoxidans]|uniref:helix-hairpin-helix domain-containing protein n=1 Tax=Desulfuromonas acetoxidans TaxID=891 RepID=UPI00292F1129|nr:helix-hairpin-helix domain-containing protein [Desulfuromonas acetoxidans]
MLTQAQKDALKQLTFEHLSLQRLFTLQQQPQTITQLDDAELVEFLTIANSFYRDGQPLISDHDYDHIALAELKTRQPSHPFLHTVEPEPKFTGKTVELPARMLSTEKAYTDKELSDWLKRIHKAANEIGRDPAGLQFRITPKLDGFAAFDDGDRLYTRGDGRRGTDITRAFERGLVVANNQPRGLGAGEIVVQRSYFAANLAQDYENPRNFQASVVKEKALEPAVEQALGNQAVVFYPFSTLPYRVRRSDDLIDSVAALSRELRASLDYDMDGIVIEITDDELKTYMGATRHHHRWQIAYKQNQEKAEVKVLQVVPQTSRSGRVNPVAEVEPTRLSGALIQRATAHHYGMVRDKGIGPDAVIELTRSGEVIPKIIDVVKAVEPQIPASCPSCDTELFWDSDYLYCPNNTGCPAQISHTIEHFFRTLGNIDGFGPATIEKLYTNNIRTIDAVYGLQADQLEGMGFGPKQSENLVNELQRSRHEVIEDWRFLAAFGVFRMGGGNCERLLGHHRLEEIFELSEEQIVAIEGFAERTAEVVVKGFARIRPLFDKLQALGFNLQRTPLVSELQASGALNPIAGKLLVFTGTMTHGSRDDMKAEAKKLGAKVGASVTGKTDYLVTGDKVGASKLNTATSKGVEILTEEQYLKLIGTTISSAKEQS